MNLAVILGVFWLSLGSPQSATPSEPPAPQPQSTETTRSAPAPTSQTPNPSDQGKPPAASTAKRRRHKKTTPNCSNAPVAPADPTKPAEAASTSLPPCPPPKKVVRNGGSNEPAIQLVEGTTAQQAAQQHSIDELTAATNANLKKIEGRQLSSSQQDTVTQIKQFMEQSKAAVAAGDLERSHNLATKAHLLSDELVKP